MEEKRREFKQITKELEAMPDMEGPYFVFSPLEKYINDKRDEAYELMNNPDATPRDIEMSKKMFEELERDFPYEKMKRMSEERQKRLAEKQRKLMRKWLRLRREIRELEKEEERGFESEREVAFLNKPLRF